MLCKSCAYIAHLERILRKSCAYIAHWRKKYNLVQILLIYCTSLKEVQSCKNLIHLLRIGETGGKKYNLVQILLIYSALEK